VPAACRRLVDAIGSRHRLVARAAVSERAGSVRSLHEAYQDAWEALRLGARVLPDRPVHAIADLRIHQALIAVGRRGRVRLIERVGARLPEQPDWPTLQATVIAWCESGFSLVRTAAALHIHRNTLIYRLAKIEQLAGRPVREGPAALALYLACIAEQLETG
jgi:carbohydrate diacid regulator